jgi:hypothetical protein
MVLDDLKDSVTNIVGVANSATAFINGAVARQEAAVAAALANGATAAQLAPVTDEIAAMKVSADALAAAIAANP